MDFEDILKDVGGFGLYQKILVIVFLVPAYIVIPWFSMNTVFMSNEPRHWCHVPQVAISNLSVDEKILLVGPREDPFCSMYDVDYGDILRSPNRTVDPNWPTKPCIDGWEYDTSNYDATSVTKWNMVCKDAHYSSLFLSVIFIGDVIGTPIYGFLSDKWGRKPTFFFLALIIAITEVGSTFSPQFALFLVLRAINGSTMSIIYGVGYIISLELVEPEMRTRMNGIATASWTAGLCLLPVLAYFTRNWVYLSVVTSSTALCLLLYWKVVPESPSWLISQGRYEEAALIMNRISKTNGKTAHEGNQLLTKIQKLGERLKKRKAGEAKSSPMDFLRYPVLRKRFLLVTFCWIGNSLPYFGLQFNVKNLGGNEFINFFLMSAIEVPAHLVTWLFMERIGRRWCSVSAFTLSTLACFLPVLMPSDDATIGIAATLLAKAGTSSAFMTLYQQGPELFPTNLRGVGIALSGTIGTGSTLVVPYIVFLSKYGTYIPFLVFAVISMFSAIFVSFLPETLHKKLPQTTEDAENFERDFRYFSCGSGKESSEDVERRPSQNTWSPRTLSAVDVVNAITDEAMTRKQSSSSSTEVPNGLRTE